MGFSNKKKVGLDRIGDDRVVSLFPVAMLGNGCRGLELRGKMEVLVCCDGVIQKQRDEIFDFAKGKEQELGPFGTRD